MKSTTLSFLHLQQSSLFSLSSQFRLNYVSTKKCIGNGKPLVLCCSSTEPPSTAAEYSPASVNAPPLKKKRKRYRKKYPGESVGITEEMRFVAMRLRNNKGKRYEDDDDNNNNDNLSQIDDTNNHNDSHKSQIEDSFINGVERNEQDTTWKPSMEGFVKYLVDSKLVFDTIERIVDESSDVSYAYFRKTGLERSQSLSKDLDWLRQQDIVIPEPSSPGITYANYLEKLSEKSAPLFLSHFYNIYFAHIAGGQVIARKVSDKLLEGRELESYRWETEMEESLKDVREKLNLLGEHWSRDESNRCLIEANKSFKFLGQIIRLIIL